MITFIPAFISGAAAGVLCMAFVLATILDRLDTHNQRLPETPETKYPEFTVPILRPDAAPGSQGVSTSHIFTTPHRN